MKTAEDWTLLRPALDPAEVVGVLRRAAHTLRESAKTTPGLLVSPDLAEPLACLLEAEANTVERLAFGLGWCPSDSVCRHAADVSARILTAAAAEQVTDPAEDAKAAAWAGEFEQ